MNDSLYALPVPLRIRMESEMHLHDVQAFRNWCEAFVRPASMLGQYPLSRAMHGDLTQALQIVVRKHAEWRAAHPAYDTTAPEWNSLAPEVRLDQTTEGSPGWVHAQCVHMLRCPGGCAAAAAARAPPGRGEPQPRGDGGRLAGRVARGRLPVCGRHRHHRAVQPVPPVAAPGAAHP